MQINPRASTECCVYKTADRPQRDPEKEIDMKLARTDLPTRLQAGDLCIQGEDWGDLNVARIRFPKGADATPLLEGLPGFWRDCQTIFASVPIGEP